MKPFDFELINNYYIHQNHTLKETASYFKMSESTLKRLLRQHQCKKTKENRLLNKRKTCLQKYGASTPFESSNIQTKIKDSVQKKYGVANVSQIEDVKQKKIKTYKKHYGTAYYTQTEEYKTRIRKQAQIKYGTDSVNQKHWSIFTYNLLSSPEKLTNYLQGKRYCTVNQIATYIGCSTTTLLRKMHEYDIFHLLNHCKSSYEIEIKNLLEKWGIKVIDNDRNHLPNNLEIDLYCPDYHIGIEFNGTYWHSELNKDRFYHQRKSQQAQQQGIFLYHIFEYEWIDEHKKELIIRQLHHLFGLDKLRYYASKLKIYNIDTQVKKTFLNANHLQGNDKSSLALGLKDSEGQLLMIATFCKPRYNHNSQWELSRLCSSQGTTVIGGASRLIKYFYNNYLNIGETLISYSDVSKTRGEVYDKLGFICDSMTPPNYVWCNDKNEIFTRYQTQMKNEVAIMQGKGFFRIYNCGNKIWILKKEKQND